MNRPEILRKALDVYGINSQVDMMIEEMSELAKALLKQRRAGKVTMKLTGNILEEIADVQIVLDQLKIHYGQDDAEAYEEWKLYRLEERMGK